MALDDDGFATVTYKATEAAALERTANFAESEKMQFSVAKGCHLGSHLAADADKGVCVSKDAKDAAAWEFNTDQLCCNGQPLAFNSASSRFACSPDYNAVSVELEQVKQPSTSSRRPAAKPQDVGSLAPIAEDESHLSLEVPKSPRSRSTSVTGSRVGSKSVVTGSSNEFGNKVGEALGARDRDRLLGLPLPSAPLQPLDGLVRGNATISNAAGNNRAMSNALAPPPVEKPSEARSFFSPAADNNGPLSGGSGGNRPAAEIPEARGFPMSNKGNKRGF